MFPVSGTYAQFTVSTTTTFANNNGSGTVTFNFANHSNDPIAIIKIESVMGVAGNKAVEVWTKTTPINGVPGVISTANGWVQEASGTVNVTSASTSANDLTTLFSGINIVIPANTTIAMAVYGDGQRYSTIPAGLDSITNMGVSLIYGTNVSYGGGAPNGTAPTNTPRGWIGTITFAPLTPCSGMPNAGAASVSNSTPCVGQDFDLTLIGSSFGSGLTYQWQSATSASGPWTNISGATSFTYTVPSAVSGTTYYRAAVTCSGQTAYSSIDSTTVNPAFPGGTYTINPSLPTSSTNFQTLGAAVNAISCGISGPIIFNMAAGHTFNEQITLPASIGSNATNTVTFNGNGDTVSFNGTSSQPWTIGLDGADYITFNNLVVNGEGTNAYVVHLWNDADHNTFYGCTFIAPENGTATTQIPFSVSGSPTAMSSGPSGNYNTVDSCIILNGYYNTYFYGNSSNPAVGNQVINSRIEDFYFYGTYNFYQSDMLIKGNIVSRPNRTTLSSFYGIYFSTGVIGSTIEGNYLTKQAGANPSQASAVYNIYVSSTTANASNPNKIINNIIGNVSGNSTFAGIYLPSAVYTQVYFNTISIDNTAATSGTVYGIYSTGTSGGIDIQNNNVSITQGGSGTKYAMYFSTSAAGKTSNYNNLYMGSTAGTNNYGYLSSAIPTFAGWQAAGGGVFDQNSVNLEPMFANSAGDNFTPTNAAMDDLGTPIAGITTDFNGASRSATSPDIGAVEFSVAACTGTVSAGTASASVNSICAGESFSLETLNASAPAGGQTSNWQSAPSPTGPWTDISGAITPSYSVGLGISTVTSFRYWISCSNSNSSDTSNVITVNLNPANQCYCTPPAPSIGGLYWIDSVSTTGGTVNISNMGTGVAPTGYMDYSATHEVAVDTGGSFTLTVSNQNGASPGITVWIDWNQNGSFESSEQVYTTTTGTSSSMNTYTIPIQVPSGTQPGSTRMRIRNYGSSGTNPCNQTSYGEVEDYMVTINTPGPTFGTIEIGTTGTVSSTYYPNYYLYDYSYTQTIYSAAEMISGGAPGPVLLTKIYYKPKASVSTVNWKDWVIYMANTNQNGFASTSNTIAVANMTEVFNGTLPANVTANNWIELTLSAPFLWDGTSNLVVAVDENTPNYGNTPNWAGYSATSIVTGQNRGVHFYQDGTNISPNSPSASFSGTSNTIAQVMFDWVAANACSGTVSAGTASGPATVCATNSFVLTTNGASLPAVGISGNWQSAPSPSGPWTDIIGANSTTYNVAGGITSATSFRYWMECSSNNSSDTSNIVTIGLNPPNQCYCTPPAPTNSGLYWINSVSTTGATSNFSNLNTGASTSGYTDYSSTYEVITSPTSSFTLTVENQNGASPGITVWIDWDQNGVFDASEQIYTTTTGTSSALNTYTIPVQVPASALSGSTKMRIRNYGSSGTNPCNQTSYGEVEDYKVTIQSLPPCTGAPNAGSIDTVSFSICATEPFTLSTTGYTTGGGITYQWQEKVGSGAWTDITGANSTILSFPNGITTATSYRMKVECTASNLSATTSDITVSLNPGLQCYCTPTYTYNCSSGDDISNVTLNGVTTNINNSTACSPNGYGDYTNLAPADLETGGTYSLSVSTSYSSPENEDARAWIDWNQNGTFEASEEIFNTNNNGLGGSGSTAQNFTVPVGQANGSYRMRVRLVYSGGSLIDPCTNASFGETEDYMVSVVTAGTPCTTPIVNLGNDTTICAGSSITLDAGNSNPGSTYAWSTGASTQTITASTSGTYVVTVTDGNCTANDTIIITVATNPTVLLGNDTAICNGNSITLDAGAGASSYSWNTGETTQTITVDTSGTYSVTITNAAGCSGFDSILVTVNANPTVDLGGDTTICEGESITLDAGAGADSYLWNTGDSTQTITVDTEGAYSVVVTNAAGCFATDTIEVEINDLPSADSIIVSGASPTFTFEAENAENVDDYSWDFGDGNTSSLENPSHTYIPSANNQDYTVTLVISNDCGSDTLTTTVTIDGTSIRDLDAGVLKMYPNPTQQTVTIDNQSKYMMKNIVITNVLGQQVMTVKAESNQQTIDVSKLTSGMYHVTIEFEEGKAYRKLDVIK